MEPNGPIRVLSVPFVHPQSYKQIRVHLDPKIHHLAGYPLGLPQGPLGVLGPHFENRGPIGNHCWSTTYWLSYAINTKQKQE